MAMARHTIQGTTFHTEEHAGLGRQGPRLASATLPITLSYSQHEEISRNYVAVTPRTYCLSGNA
jgi:hypothetical protein